LGSPIGYSQFFVRAVVKGKNVLLISRGKLCMFCVGLAQLFIGVRLSEFSFGLRRGIFSLSGCDRKKYFVELARLIYFFGFVWLAQLFFWLSQLLV
jgi:hypothetical protein